jgi:hypothetical protein
MPTEPAYIREFKRFTQGDITIDDLPRLEAELYGTNDRASAVMQASLTESSLQTFLQSHLRPSFNVSDMRLLFDFSGILGSFAAKITVAYAFNWFGPETRHDLNLIRLIRNEFAHSRKSFEFVDAPVAAVCVQLKSPEWAGAELPIALETMADEPPWADSDRSHPRTRYRTACHTISLRLLGFPGDLR